MKPIIWIIIFIVTVSHGFSQTLTVSDPDLNGLVKLWKSTDYDSLKKLLPMYQKKYSASPEYLFLSALFNPDGGEAVKTYELIVRRHPDNIFADQSMYRLIQYHAALGMYQTAEQNFSALKSKYPKSAVLADAARLFPEKESGRTDQDGVITNDSGAVSYALQVGAFSSRSNADQFAASLKSKGITDIFTGEKTSNDKKLITVLVGSYATKEQATAAGQKLKKDHQLDYSVVTK